MELKLPLIPFWFVKAKVSVPPLPSKPEEMVTVTLEMLELSESLTVTPESTI